MKKSLALLSTAALTLGLLSGCGGTQSGTADDPGAADKGVVNVYNWGVYIDETVLEDFTAETGIKVVYDTFESNEAMYGVLKNDGASYDVVIPSDYMISRMIEEDMLEPLNFDNIPNAANVDEHLWEFSKTFDPENKYTIPHYWGTLGILYNTRLVDEKVDSWDILFNSKYSGQIIMENSVRDSFVPALKMLGYSINTDNTDELDEAEKILIEQRPMVQAYL